ncbi:MAG: hypothetical protein KAR13_16535 [Desulfobulbaceae bacterium]|nr:hypothetical protein [Desulfobulbaceae bacterium]
MTDLELGLSFPHVFSGNPGLWPPLIENLQAGRSGRLGVVGMEGRRWVDPPGRGQNPARRDVDSEAREKMKMVRGVIRRS